MPLLWAGASQSGTGGELRRRDVAGEISDWLTSLISVVAVESGKSHVRRRYVASSILVVIDAKVDTTFESSIHDPLYPRLPIDGLFTPAAIVRE